MTRTESIEEAMERGNRRNQYLITLSVSMAFVALGVSSAWATPVLPKFKENETEVDISDSEVGTMFSLSPVGFAVGSLATSYIADAFGRRVTILGSAIPITIGSIILVFAKKGWLLFITAFTWQCGTGMMSTVNGYYLSEIADKDVRATLQVITSFTFKFGNLLMMTAGPLLSYKTLNYIMLALPVTYFILCWWIPETPYFCLKKKNVEGARKSLRVLHGYKDEKVLEDELTELQAGVKDEMSNSSSPIELFTGPQYRKALIIASGLKMVAIMTGGVLIKQYLGWIISETKLKIDIKVVVIIYGAVSFVVAMMSSVLVDRVGRRPLMIYSCTGTGITLGAISVYFFLQDVVKIDSETLAPYSFVPFFCILLSNLISTLGYNSLVFVIPAEIFPMNVKAVAMTSLNIFSALLGFICAQGYHRVKDAGGSTTIFAIFSLFGIGGGVFSYYFIVETKGKNLRDIQLELQGEVYNVVGFDKSADQKEIDTELEQLKSSDNDEKEYDTEFKQIKLSDNDEMESNTESKEFKTGDSINL